MPTLAEVRLPLGWVEASSDAIIHMTSSEMRAGLHRHATFDWESLRNGHGGNFEIKLDGSYVSIYQPFLGYYKFLICTTAGDSPKTTISQL